MNSIALLRRLGFNRTKFYKIESKSKVFYRNLIGNVVSESHIESEMVIDEYHSYYKHCDNKIYEYVTEKIIRNKGDSFWNYKLRNINVWVSVSNYNIESVFIEDEDEKNIMQYDNCINSKKDLLDLLPRNIVREIKIRQLI